MRIKIIVSDINDDIRTQIWQGHWWKLDHCWAWIPWFKNRATDQWTDGPTNQNSFGKKPYLDSVGHNIHESRSFRHAFVYAETEWKWLRKSRYELGTLLWLLYSKKGNLSLQFYLCPFFQTLFEQTCSLKNLMIMSVHWSYWFHHHHCPPLSLTTHPLPLEVQ